MTPNRPLAFLLALGLIATVCTIPTASAEKQPAAPVQLRGGEAAPQAGQAADTASTDGASTAPGNGGVQKVPYLPEDQAAFERKKRKANQGDSQAPKEPDQDVAVREADTAPESAALPGTGNTFNGISQTQYVPPDTDVAAGPTDLVEVVNSKFAGYNKTGGVLFAPIELSTWFSNVTTLTSVFDPKIVYRSGRFYLVALAKNSTQSKILVSVSDNSSGPGSWCNYAFEGTSTPIGGTSADRSWADFPGVGVTSSHLHIATNQFRFSNNTFTDSMVTIVSRSTLDAACGASQSVTQWINFFNPNNTRAFTMQPATDYDSFGATAAYFANGFSGGGSSMTVWRYLVSSAGWQSYAIGSGSYSIPPDARQPGTATLIATNDARNLKAVKRFNRLYISHETGYSCASGTRSALHNVEFNAPASTTTAPTLRLSQYITGCTSASDLYYPAGTYDQSANTLWAANQSSTSLYPRLIAGGNLVGSYQGSVQVGANSGAFTETRGRWGDYSGISLDPSDQNKAWVAGELLQANNSWTTRIGQAFHKGAPLDPSPAGEEP